MSNPIYEFTFLRHAESVGNAEVIYQGQGEFPLTAKGITQAQVLARRWKKDGITFDRIISSPLGRAKQTAEILQSSLEAPLIFDPVWMERHNGALSGVSQQEAKKVFPRPEFIGLYDPTGGSGESDWALYLRAVKALTGLLKNLPGRYLIVSHGGLLNKALAAILGVPLTPNLAGVRLRFANTGFCQIAYTPEENRWRVHQLNDSRHISEDHAPTGDYRFTLLRHGESEGNAQKVFQGQKDYPLTKTGIAQAEQLAYRWKRQKVSFTKIISSPQSRARQTADSINRQLGLDIEEESLLKEIDCGRLAGMSLEKIRQAYPSWQEDTQLHTATGETGESRWEFHVRAGHALHNLMKNPPGDYLVVSHGGTLNQMLYAMLGISPQQHPRQPIFQFSNTGYAILDYDSNTGSWAFHRFNGANYEGQIESPPTKS